MSTKLSTRLVRQAMKIASPRISIDEFTSEVTDTHIELLDSLESLKLVQQTLERANLADAANRLAAVKASMEKSLEVLRTLDELYHQGKLSYGPNAPRGFQWSGSSVMKAQESPGKDRITRSKPVQP